MPPSLCRLLLLLLGGLLFLFLRVTLLKGTLTSERPLALLDLILVFSESDQMIM